MTVGAEGQGMVAGDLVNTASRVQSAAEPARFSSGRRRGAPRSRQSRTSRPAPRVEGQGRADGDLPSSACRLGRGGAEVDRPRGPVRGRDRELKLDQDLFHASAQDRRAHLVSVTGIGGIGKSRLAWEFYKYFDGIVEQIWWHRGRCLAYGEGVAYWALADMVRMRCRIAEDDPPSRCARS